MNEKELVTIFERLGWESRKDEVGDTYCIINSEDLLISAIPCIGKRSDHFRVSFRPSVSTRAFSEAVSNILSKKNDHEPIVVNFGVPYKLAEVTEQSVIQLSEDALKWAKAQNVEAGLAAYRALPTDAKGAMPLRHLAALAIAGDRERLLNYKHSFEQGDRLGFVPYITLDMIERALMIAQQSISNRT